MTVSIMVLTYNRAHMIGETIDSILNQTYRDFELLVIDNYSADNTREVIENYNDDRIRYFKNRNFGKLAVNRNYAIKRSRGDLIAICDDDDLWLPEKLERQVRAFENSKNTAVVCTNGVNFTSEGDIGLKNDPGLTDSDFTFDALIWKNPIINSSTLFKKDVAVKLGGFNERPDIIAGEDYHLWLRIAKKYRIKYLNESLIRYRTHPGAWRKEDDEAYKLELAIFKLMLDEGYIDKTLFDLKKGKMDRTFEYNKLYKKVSGKNREDKDKIGKLIPNIMENRKITAVDKLKLLLRWEMNLISPRLSGNIAHRIYLMLR